MTLRLSYSAHSETGPVRKNNQDSCYASPTMLIVADGMGGAAAGDLASAVVIREMRTSDTGRTGDDMLTALAGAVSQASDSIAGLVEMDPDLDGMGSTATGVAFDGERLAVINIGDSRTYVFRDGKLQRLTHDHSWVQSLVDEGRISEEESLIHPHRSLILRVINGQPQHTPDLRLADVHEGDRLLVCSDGLCGLVTDAAIERNMDGPRDEVMQNLIEIALEQGGLDNLTIILADAENVPDDEPFQSPVVLGAAERIDLDAPLDTLAVEVPPEEAPAVAAPRPDPSFPERARYAPTSRHHVGTWIKVVLGIVVAFAVIGFGCWGGYTYTQQQYYVAASGDYVALYRGIPDPVFNLPLSSVVETSQTRVADLPTYYQGLVTDNSPVASYDKGRELLITLSAKARDCVLARQQQATPAPGTSASPTPHGSPSASAKPSPGVIATPAASTPPADLEGCG